MKIIFLDVDGVLVTGRTGYSRKKLDKEAARNLKRIVDKTDAVFVISSTWRYSSMDLLEELLKDSGLDNRIIGSTPRLEEKRGLIFISKGRGAEISAWLKGSSEHTYIVIDDERGDIHPHLSRLVKTDSHVGITKENADKALELLLKDK